MDQGVHSVWKTWKNMEVYSYTWKTWKNMEENKILGLYLEKHGIFLRVHLEIPGIKKYILQQMLL